MAIQLVQPNFNRNAEIADESNNLAKLLGATQTKQMEGQQALANEAAKAQNAQKLEKYKAVLGEEAIKRNLGTVKETLNSGDLPEGSGMSLDADGKVAVTRGVNPVGLAAQGAKAYTGAINFYNQKLPDEEKKLTAAERLYGAISDPANPITAGTARSLLLNIHGMNRFNEEEANAMVGPTMANQLKKAMTFLGSNEGATLNDAQRAGIVEILNDSVGSVKSQHDMYKKQAQETYRMHPYATPEGMNTLQSIGGPMDKRLQTLTETVDREKKKLAAAKVAREQQMNSGLSGWLKGAWQRAAGTPQQGPKTVVRTGTNKVTGKRVVQYSDGTTEEEQ